MMSSASGVSERYHVVCPRPSSPTATHCSGGGADDPVESQWCFATRMAERTGGDDA